MSFLSRLLYRSFCTSLPHPTTNIRPLSNDISLSSLLNSSPQTSFLSHILYRSFCSSLPHPTTTINIRSLCNDIYKERNLGRLVEKFKKYSEYERFRTKVGIYKSTILRLAFAKKFILIEEILEDQKKYSNISREEFNGRLISLYGKSGMFDHASKVFDEMPDHKCDRTVRSFNALLGACVNSKKFDKITGFFHELPEKLSIKPNVVSYNIMIKAFCEMGTLDSAISMLDEMEKNGLDPDVITFNTLLDTFYGRNRFVDGEKIWARMENKNVVPNIRSYNARLVGLATEKKMSEAVELVAELGAKRLKADVFTYNAMIGGYCMDGSIEEAKRWYRELASKDDCAADKSTFTMLVPFVCENGDFDYAFELCKTIIHSRCLVDAKLLQDVVDGLVKQSKIEEAKTLVQLGYSNNYTRYNLKMPSDK
ncbi:small ribosomal subunit protein mS78 (rPPR3a)-like [Cornus florida]|uniref:small ribosomal subunit protein mS78 (rPPR3a)-like n=1 Tax=Cornus florida TaxID=4283 RepID=UPI00289E930B|nr:small ribosomal subunit protein mS78 (rPPR3a)-like [Cornus florida]